MSTHAPRILIVDNGERIVCAIASRLENLGYECETACSGTEGLEDFRVQPHDLVITDLNMPAGDGIDLTEAVRAESTVPIIVITGFEAAYRPQLDRFENIAVLQKPFDTTDLVDLVETELVMAGCTLP